MPAADHQGTAGQDPLNPISQADATIPTNAAAAARHWIAGALFGLHLSLALYYRHVAGIRITADPERDTWDWFWQTLPTDLLRSNMLESLWNLHAQPPIHNLYGGVLLKLFEPHHLEWMHHINMVLGGLMTVMLYRLTARLTARLANGRWIPTVTSLLLATSPALILYESYILYTLLAAFLGLCSVYWLVEFQFSQRLRHLLLCVLCVNLLMLTRTVFHLTLLAVILPFVAIVARHAALHSSALHWRRAVGFAMLLSLPTVGWYAKNQVKFGFFGATSWSGQNLWKIAISNVSGGQATEFLRDLELDPAATNVRVFSAPSAYQRYGFRAHSTIPALNRNDHNNINMIGISRMYGTNAVRVITHDPLQYLRTVSYAYGVYCRPASEYEYLYINRTRMRRHEQVYSDWILGRSFCRWLGRNTWLEPGSILYFLLPICLLGHCIAFIRRTRVRLSAMVHELCREPAMLFSAGLIAFATVISCCFDYEENMRFRFVIEPILFAYLATLAARGLNRGRQVAGPCSTQSNANTGALVRNGNR